VGRKDFRTPRLYVDDDLSSDAILKVVGVRANHLINVSGFHAGDDVLVFNGRDGEWLAKIKQAGDKTCRLAIEQQTHSQPEHPDLSYLFAPLKRARLEYMVQKAVEMGVGRLQPVITHHTQTIAVNSERLKTYAIEAAQQCGILSIPHVEDAINLLTVLEQWDPARRLIFCDEAADEENSLKKLAKIPPGPLAVLVGPEGGFSEQERKILLRQEFVTPISLGPRILRAEDRKSVV